MTLDEKKILSSRKIVGVRENRLKNLRKSKKKYTIKLFPQQTNPWLLSNSTKIFIYRKNYFEHLLSFLLSTTTGQFYEPHGILARENSIYVPQELFIEFIKRIRAYRKIRKQFDSSREIAYEDFLKYVPAEIICAMGWKKRMSWKKLKISKKQNQIDKLSYFINKDEIRYWYKSSELQSYFAI